MAKGFQKKQMPAMPAKGFDINARLQAVKSSTVIVDPHFDEIGRDKCFDPGTPVPVLTTAFR